MKLISLLCFLSLLVGCISHPKVIPATPDDEKFAPPQMYYDPVPANPGSLYSANYSMGLFNDRRAFQTGDLLMVVLSEATQSDKSATTNIAKESSVSIPTPTIGNLNTSEINAAVDADRDFGGAATSTQGNNLSGVISVVVHRVLPNGVLEVRGEKWLSLNQGNEYIRLKGYVRPEDIDSENRILSQRVADARITYSGTGSLADSNEPGWLTQFFNSPWVPM